MKFTARAHEDPSTESRVDSSESPRRSLGVDNKYSRRPSFEAAAAVAESRDVSSRKFIGILQHRERKAKMFIMSCCCLEGNKADRGKDEKGRFCAAAPLAEASKGESIGGEFISYSNFISSGSGVLLPRDFISSL